LNNTRHIPGAGKRRWWRKKGWQEAIYSIPPIVVALLGAATLRPPASDIAKPIGYAVAVWLAAAAALRVAVARAEDIKDDPGLVHEGLHAIVATLHEMLTAYYTKMDKQASVRVTFHRVVPPIDKPESIEQIVPYVGWPSDGTGRRFSVNTGITGKAIRTKEVVAMSSTASSPQEHQAELVREWGYTEETAVKLTQGRVSAVAVPVLDSSGHNALGVLYLDSDCPAAFDDTATMIVMLGSQVINRFVTRRYKL
jgi:hypothetical protein